MNPIALLVFGFGALSATPPSSAQDTMRGFAVTTFDGRHHIMTGGEIPEHVQLRRLEPHSFDDTSVADAPALQTPSTWTLIGNAGACIVRSQSRRFVHRWNLSGPAIAVGTDQCDIGEVVMAVEGGLPRARATFHRDAGEMRADEVTRWVRRVLGVEMWTLQGVPVVSMTRLVDDVDVVTAFTAVPTPTRSATIELLLRRGDTVLHRRTEAKVVATLRVDGRTYALVTKDDGAGELLPL